MGEVVNFVVAVAVIVFVFKWATSGKDGAGGAQSPSAILGFKPKNITPEQVETIHNMFPDIPSDNIRYDLLRTGSVQLTSNKILERGYLPAPPPAYYTVYPRAVEAQQPANPQANRNANTSNTASSSKTRENLITKFDLQTRVASPPPAASSPSEGTSTALENINAAQHKWEDTPEKREASLRERKARMVLAARERLLAQQKAAASSTSS